MKLSSLVLEECPRCHQRTIDLFSKSFCSPSFPVTCSCGAKVHGSWASIYGVGALGLGIIQAAVFLKSWVLLTAGYVGILVLIRICPLTEKDKDVESKVQQ